jgi:hypothetical protein
VARRFSAFASGKTGRFMLSVLPTVIIFAVVEWLLITDRASFADPLSIIGTLAIPLLGGIFPMLLLAAARRRGDRVPASWLRVLPGPVAIAFVGAVFLAGLLVQGFVVWQEPAEWIATALVAILILGVAWTAARRGAFRPQATIEFRREPSGRDRFVVTVDGRPKEVNVEIPGDQEGRSIRGAAGNIELEGMSREVTFALPRLAVRELRVWVHAITPEGDSEPIPAQVRVTPQKGADQRLEAPTGSLSLAIDEGPMAVHILVK